MWAKAWNRGHTLPQPNTETAGHALGIVLLVEEVESAALPAGPEEDCGVAKS